MLSLSQLSMEIQVAARCKQVSFACHECQTQRFAWENGLKLEEADPRFAGEGSTRACKEAKDLYCRNQ